MQKESYAQKVSLFLDNVKTQPFPFTSTVPHNLIKPSLHGFWCLSLMKQVTHEKWLPDSWWMLCSELLKTKTIVSGAVSRQARWLIRRPLLTAGVSLWEQSNQEVRCCSMWVTRLQGLCSHLQIEFDFWSCWSHQLKDQIYFKIAWVYFFWSHQPTGPIQPPE